VPSLDQDPSNEHQEKPAGVLKWTLGVVVVTLLASAVFVVTLTSGPNFGAVVEQLSERQGQRAASPRSSAGQGVRELSYRATRNGHFIIDAAINGTEIALLFDSGASTIALSPDDAERLGIRRNRLRFTERYETANGVIMAAPVTLDQIRIGQLVYYNVEAAVIDAPISISLLGMSFLGRLDSFEVAGDRLILRW